MLIDIGVPSNTPGAPGSFQGQALGSSNVSYRPSNGQTITQRYYPWGTIRPGPDNALPTDYTFTGQKLDESMGLMYYGARYYDAALGRFVQADTIVPNPANPQDLNRYAYVRNNPLKYIDPTGYAVDPWGGGGNPPTELPPEQPPGDTVLYLEWLDAWIRWLHYNSYDYNECPKCVTVSALREEREGVVNWILGCTSYGGEAGQRIASVLRASPWVFVPAVKVAVETAAYESLAFIGERIGGADQIPDEAFVSIQRAEFGQDNAAEGLRSERMRSGRIWFGKWRDFKNLTVSEADYRLKIEGRWNTADQAGGLDVYVITRPGFKPTYAGDPRPPGSGTAQWMYEGTIGPQEFQIFHIE